MKKLFNDNFFLILFLLGLNLSCNNIKKHKTGIKNHIQEEDTAWFAVPKRVKVEDSTKIICNYQSSLDSIERNIKDSQRWTFLIVTDTNISPEYFKKLVKNTDMAKMRELGMKSYSLEDRDSLSFNWSFSKPGINFLVGLIDDKIIFDDKNGKTRVLHFTGILKKKVVVLNNNN